MPKTQGTSTFLSESRAPAWASSRPLTGRRVVVLGGYDEEG